jgi:putative flippase GtrA
VPATTSSEPGARSRGALWRLSTYSAGSIVAAVCSELTLLLCYGVLGLAPAFSSALAWLAGALPNYWLNRSWTWGRRGRPSMRREVLPYVGIIVVTVALAALATAAVDEWLRSDSSSSTVRVGLVGGTFLGVYVVMFAVRYLLLDKLFRHPDDASSAPAEGPHS